MDKREAERLVSQAKWYHGFEVYPGVMTPGKCKCDPPEALDVMGVPRDITNKTVIDIGAWDGPFSFEMERRGGKVTSFDIQDPSTTGYLTAKKIKESACRYVQASIYDLSPQIHGTFDICLFLGVYYHLKNPLLAFERIYNILNDGGHLYYEGVVLDHAYNIDPAWKAQEQLIGDSNNVSFSLFTRGNFMNDWSNWFIPNAQCLRDWVIASGFDVTSQSVDAHYSRAFGKAIKRSDADRTEHAILT